MSQSDTTQAPLPAERTLTTRGGISLKVRPALEADEAALADLFDKVSDEDRRFRFFTAAQHVSHEQLDPLIHADHRQSESFLAYDEANGELIASAMLACDKAMDTAEVAVSIRSDYKGRGVGWALMDVLGEEARARGVRRAISIESRANHAAIELERERGYVASAIEGDPSLVLLTKQLR